MSYIVGRRAREGIGIGAGRTARRSAAAIAVAVLVLGALAPSVMVRAGDESSVATVREQLSRERGISPSRLVPVYERSLPVEASGTQLWAGKFLDEATGTVIAGYRAADGTVGDATMLDEAVEASRAALSPLARKADIPLIDAVRAGAPDALLPVAVWLDVDVTAAEATVVAAHPEVEWLAGRPLPASLEQARELRGELWTARRDAYAAAAEEFARTVEQLGARIGYVSTSAPLVFVDAPADAVAAVAERSDVLSLGLENAWRETMSSAGPTVSANWTSGSGDQGNGVRVAVVEYHNAANTGDLSGQVVSRYSTTGQVVTGVHPTWVAGAIASRNGTWTGVAPGADVVSASTGGYAPSLATDRAIIAAADWAISPTGGDADILNASIGQDTATGAEEARRYFDAIGWEDGRLVVAASGNYSTFGNWDVVSPGTGYNVMTVGGVDDRQTGGVGDDRLWYVPGSDGAAYRDRTDAAWNQHGDYNKPNLSAPAVNVRTANGTYGSGTSIASPIVAGIAAQLVARAPSLAAWPEATRAILMAGSVRRTPLPSGGMSADHEGVGTANALWANRVLDNGPFGGYRTGAFQGTTLSYSIPVVQGQQVRVALAWSSHTSGTSNTGKADVLASDLDLVVRQPSGSTTGSYTFDNSYESVTVTAASTGTMRLEVQATRSHASQEPFAIAWSLTSPFSDVAGGPFYTDILWLAGEGITNGCGIRLFCPRAAVTRGEMATFLARALDLAPSSTDFYTDDDGSVHEPQINAVSEAGIALGCGDRRFCPTRAVTRAEMATFLVRALHLAPTNRDYFSDDAGSLHEPAINALAAAGVTNGCGAGLYCPEQPVSREQMAAFLRRALAG